MAVSSMEPNLTFRCASQGLIQGPEEFAQGIALGVKSLVGGTVGKLFLVICVNFSSEYIESHRCR